MDWVSEKVHKGTMDLHKISAATLPRAPLKSYALARQLHLSRLFWQIGSTGLLISFVSGRRPSVWVG